MSARRILYVFRNPPHGSIDGQEGLDALLAGAAFDQDVQVLFMDDGVFQLLRGQDASAIAGKDYTRGFAALRDFCESLESGGIFVDSESLRQRGLEAEDLAIAVELVSADGIRALFEGQHAVLNF